MRCVREGEKKAGPCWGEVKRYSFDMDLPPLELCQGHLLEITVAWTPDELDG